MKEHKPLYPYSLEEAIKDGEIDLYNQSHKENIACAQAIKQAIADNYDGYHIKLGTEKEIIKKYGFDRTIYVLANTIQHFRSDGRISIYNKDWADTIYIPDNNKDPKRNVDFLIDDPGLVNIFASEVRDRYRELNLWRNIHCISATNLDFENKIMVLNPFGIKDEYKTPDFQLFLAQSGFGCSPTARGKLVYGVFLADGEHTHFERSQFIGQLKPALVPDWAKEKAKEFQHPSIRKQLTETPKQTKQKSQNIDKGAR